MQATFIKTFPYGGSVRTLYRISRPLADRTPVREYILRIYRGFANETSWLAAYSTGEIMCFHPICAADMAEIEAAVSSAHLTEQ